MALAKLFFASGVGVLAYSVWYVAHLPGGFPW